MDNNLARLNKQYPNGSYVLIPKYRPDQWEGRDYDSHFDNKASLNRWQTKPLSYDEAQQKVEEGYRIGWVVPQGYVVVDIDNTDDPSSQERIEHILKKFEVRYSYNYTSRGMHILFKDPTENIKSTAKNKCGLNIEIDTRANGTGYIILPCNDPHREWGTWTDCIENIPYFLLPIGKRDFATFIGMSDGDGRNDALFKWRGILEKAGRFTTSEVEKTIRTINENLFETPLSNKELFSTVLREDTQANEVTVEDDVADNIFNLYAEKLLSQVDLVYFGGTFYLFNGIYYKKLSDIEVEVMIHKNLSVNITSYGRREIMNFLKLKGAISTDDIDKDWYKIACKNGVLNLVTAEIEPANKTEINTKYIDYAFHSDPPYSPRIDEFMKSITGADPIKIEFLYQIVGYCLLKKNIFQKFFIMQGEGGTGKSTFTNLMQKLIGSENCSTVSLSDMDNGYFISTMMGKLLNIDDDVAEKALKYTGTFKSIVSGDKITVRQIFQEPVDYTPYCTLLFNCNKIPRLLDKTSGLYRRIILIELNHKVKTPDPLFLNKITDSDMEYFFYKSVMGIKTAIEEGKFRIMYSENKLMQLFKRRQSPINEWIYDNNITVGDLQDQECQPFYVQFTDWCSRNGYDKVCTSFSFREELRCLYDMEVTVERIDGRVVQRYHKVGEFDPNFVPFS